MFKAVCGLGAAALHQSTIPVEKKVDIELTPQCHTVVKSEATSVIKKLVGNMHQVNPEFLRYIINILCIIRDMD